MKNKASYIPAELDVVKLDAADVISTSVQYDPDAWNDGSDVDNGGWT